MSYEAVAMEIDRDEEKGKGGKKGKETAKVEPKASQRRKERGKVTIQKVPKAARASQQFPRAKERVERLQISLAMCLQDTVGIAQRDNVSLSHGLKL